MLFTKAPLAGGQVMNVARFFCSKVTEKLYKLKKCVLISQSTDIYYNLALEDWFYKNIDLNRCNLLLLWQNEPCVVIGRHQNPWLEANVASLKNITEKGVNLARRNSGGGTVYHDLGNLNLTFFTPRELYNRKNNLQIIKRAIYRQYGIHVDISKREDLVFNDCKISGTAAKLGRTNSYHHCTLLINVNKDNLRQALKKHEFAITTNATKSVPSKIINLVEIDPDITVKTLMTSIGWEYLRSEIDTVLDGGPQLAKEQNGFQIVNPTEAWFPGIEEIQKNLQDWDWCFGKTPKFTVAQNVHFDYKSASFSIEVEKGLVNKIDLTRSVNFNVCEEIEDLGQFTGRIYDEELLLPTSPIFKMNHSQNFVKEV